jgi:hypothetical protein
LRASHGEVGVSSHLGHVVGEGVDLGVERWEQPHALESLDVGVRGVDHRSDLLGRVPEAPDHVEVDAALVPDVVIVRGDEGACRFGDLAGVGDRRGGGLDLLRQARHERRRAGVGPEHRLRRAEAALGLAEGSLRRGVVACTHGRQRGARVVGA